MTTKIIKIEKPLDKVFGFAKIKIVNPPVPSSDRAGFFIMENRVFIIIDGNNFYHRLKELKLKNLLNFDYEKFTQFLVGKRNLVLKKYYIGAIREEPNNPKSRELMRNQRILLGKLQKQGWQIVLVTC